MKLNLDKLMSSTTNQTSSKGANVRIVKNMRRRASGIHNSEEECRTEMDSHADTCVAGSNCRKVESSGRTVGYSDTLAPTENVPIAKIATLHTDSETGGQF
jgi:hypothetical protein